MTESRLQTAIIKFLKLRGVYVLKTKPSPGIPVGCPDIIGLHLDQWLAIEVKKSATAPYRPGQEATLKRLKAQNFFVYTVYPENWSQVREELEAKFFLG